jgi:putative FmdB family regulatory protein
MPLYEYQCESCGDVFEVRQKFSDEPLKVHEKGCGGPVHRLLSAPALQFKGSGWYVTDYGRSGSKSDSNGSKSESKESGKTESKTETKPASTSTSSDKKD